MCLDWGPPSPWQAIHLIMVSSSYCMQILLRYYSISRNCNKQQFQTPFISFICDTVWTGTQRTKKHTQPMPESPKGHRSVTVTSHIRTRTWLGCRSETSVLPTSLTAIKPIYQNPFPLHDGGEGEEVRWGRNLQEESCQKGTFWSQQW